MTDALFSKFPSNNLQYISHPSQHPLQRLLHTLNDLNVGIFSQIVFEVNLARKVRIFFSF